MEIRKYIAEIGKSKNEANMKELGDILNEVICMCKEPHPDIYEKYKMKLYVMAYGKVLNREMAEDIVYNMEPYGEEWDFDTTSKVKMDYGLKDISDVDFYVVMNKTYNDNHDTVEKFVEEPKRLDMYISLTKDFILDPDAKEGKVFTYFTSIPK